MNLSLVVSVAFARIVQMPMGPIPSELQLGMRLAEKNRNPDSVFLGARQVTGKWFDGSKRQIIEEVIWLSPDFLSRWLGYLSVKEGWNETEIETRWIKLKATFGWPFSSQMHSCCAAAFFPSLEIDQERWCFLHGSLRNVSLLCNATSRAPLGTRHRFSSRNGLP